MLSIQSIQWVGTINAVGTMDTIDTIGTISAIDIIRTRRVSAVPVETKTKKMILRAHFLVLNMRPGLARPGPSNL